MPQKTGHPRPVQQVLDRLRYDDTYNADGFRVIYEAGRLTEQRSRNFSEWSFGDRTSDFIASRRILRFERQWDDVEVWEPARGMDIFSRPVGPGNQAFGVASEVNNDEGLIQVTWVSPHDTGDSIRKAEFEFVDQPGEQCKGVVYPGRLHDDHGLILSRGPDFDGNRKILRGTALEKASWTEVKEYVTSSRESPLS